MFPYIDKDDGLVPRKGNKTAALSFVCQYPVGLLSI